RPAELPSPSTWRSVLVGHAWSSIPNRRTSRRFVRGCGSMTYASSTSPALVSIRLEGYTIGPMRSCVSCSAPGSDRGRSIGFNVLGWRANVHAVLQKKSFRLLDGELAEVEDGCGEHGIGAAFDEPCPKVF